MSSDTPQPNRTDPSTGLTNVVTIVGQGIPSSYEITVEGDIEAAPDRAGVSSATVSGSSAEGTIDVGVERFHFSGELMAISFVGRSERYEPGSPYVPRVSIDYNVRER